MTVIVIEHGVPIPRIRQSKYPFSEMHVGDSFVRPGKENGSLATIASRFCRANPGWKFTVRLLANGEYRVWCVARPVDDQPMRVGGAAR